MIYGIGTDIVSIERINEALSSYADKFAQRILSADEYAEFATVGQQQHFLAKRFAVKEAFAKALGTGIRDAVAFKAITVSHNALGKPELQFSPELQALLTANKITQTHVSISDEKTYAVAFVILEQ